MPKVDLELVKRVMERNQLDIRTVSQVLEELQFEITSAVDDEDKPPPVKKQFVILLSDPEGTVDASNLAGWVLQIPEEDSPAVVTERLIRSAYEFNVTKKGRRLPSRTIGETCESVPARIFKEQNVWVKTKYPVAVMTTDNVVPLDKLDPQRAE